MPIYEYRCEKGHLFEVLQKFSDEPLSECEQCGSPVERVFHPVAVHFKGSGFYSTDYGKKKRGKGGESETGSKQESDTSKSSESSPKSDAAGKSDSKASSGD